MHTFKLFAGMGFSGAVHESVLEFTDEEYDDLVESGSLEETLWEEAEQFAQQYVEAWYEEA